MVQIELAAGHCGEMVAVNTDPGAVVAETNLVRSHGVWITRCVDLYRSGKAREKAVCGIRFWTFTNGCGLRRTVGVDQHPRVCSIYTPAFSKGTAGQIVECATFKCHPLYIPQPHMFGERGVVGGKEVVVIFGKSTTGKCGVVIGNATRRCGIGVRIDHHRLSVVFEDGVGGRDYAARGSIDGISV